MASRRRRELPELTSQGLDIHPPADDHRLQRREPTPNHARGTIMPTKVATANHPGRRFG